MYYCTPVNHKKGPRAFIVTPETDQSPALLNDHTCWPHRLRHCQHGEQSWAWLSATTPAHAAGAIAPNGQGDHGRVKHAQSRNYTRVSQSVLSIEFQYKSLHSTSSLVDVSGDTCVRKAISLDEQVFTDITWDRGQVKSVLSGYFILYIRLGASIWTPSRYNRAHHVIQDLLFLSVPRPTSASFVPCMTNPY